MVRRLGCCVVMLLVLARGAAAQDEMARAVYASMEQAIHGEYEAMLAGFARDAVNNPSESAARFVNLLKIIFYNKAALYAACAAEADHARPPDAANVPPSMNPALRTCLEQRLGQLQKFTQVVEYARTFFPERIEPCGERSRLPEQEKVWRPYRFLHLDEPRLYDFDRYNTCLMTP